MNQESSKLGRGLGSLLSGDKNKSDNKEFKKINISEIVANPTQPRKFFDKEKLQDLADSIKSQGVLQPIVVRLTVEKNYEIVAGERRWRAAQIAGTHAIPAIIREMNEGATNVAALVENIQRENLNAVEEAKAYKVILKDKNNDLDILSKIIGKSKSHISNMIRLLELDEDILGLIISGKLSMGHARALIGVPNSKELALEIIAKKMSVRQIERVTSNYKKNRRSSMGKKTKDSNILDLEKELSEKIGLKTSIHFNEEGSSGSLTLFYSDLDQLDNLMQKLKK